MGVRGLNWTYAMCDAKKTNTHTIQSNVTLGGFHEYIFI